MNADSLRFHDENASHRLILLHGWGADADDLLMLGKEIVSKSSHRCEVVSLRAPHLHPEGVGRQWYGLFPPAWEDVPEAILSLKKRLLSFDQSSISLSKTILLGFSQGGAMALSSGCDLPFAGLIGCSAYPHPGWLPPLERPPVLILHGKDDEIVPYSACEQLVKLLENSQIPAELCSFEGGHSIPKEVVPLLQLKLSSWFS